jgi:hypothetical protein
MMNKFLFFTSIVIIVIFCNRLNAAEIALKETKSFEDRSTYVPTVISIKGKIESGDYQKVFSSIVKSLNFELPVEEVWLFDSGGGDLNEAIEIGKLVNELYLRVEVIGKCYSACSFIALSAKDRVFMGDMGLHRPYFNKTYYAGLSAQEAEKKYKTMSEKVKAYLKENDVPTKAIDKMFSTSSADIWVLDMHASNKLFGALKPSFYEWVKARCPNGKSHRVDVDIKCLSISVQEARYTALVSWLEKELDIQLSKQSG